MPPEAAQSRPREGWLTIFSAIPKAWRQTLAVLLPVWLGIIAAFGSDWAAMAGQWWNSSTYNHVLMVPVIIAWLVWQRAPELAQLTPVRWWPPLVFCAGAAFFWVLGAFAGLNLARQIGAVLLLVGATVCMIGPRASWALAFPLGYGLLLVPFGDELVPPLQMITAKITIALVHASAIPATIDGVFIDTPAGLFEVAEACSGVKFLIAMIAFGILVANVCFKSWTRRSLFLAVCVIVPILANGVRAWGTIFAAQYVGVEVAAGFDHIVYGWIFFALVIALVLAVGWRFFDRSVEESPVDLARIERMRLPARLESRSLSVPVLVAALAALVLGAKLWTRQAEAMRAPLADRIALAGVPGWTQVPYRPEVWWEPRARGADHRLLGSFQDKAGRRVDVSLALYAVQREGAEAGAFGEGALVPGDVWRWQSSAPALRGAKADHLRSGSGVGRAAYTWFRHGDLLTGSNARLKLANMAERLTLRPRPTVTLIVSAEERGGAPAAQAVANFVRDTGDLGAWIDHTAEVR